MIPAMESIDKDILQSLKNSRYSINEVQQIHKVILETYRLRKKGYNRATIILIVITLLFIIMSFLTPDMALQVKVFIALFMILFLIIILFIVKYFYRDKLRRLFLSAIKQGYPDLYNELEYDYNK